MVLNAFPKNKREEMDANGSNSKSIQLSNRPGPQQRKEKHSFLSPAFTLQSLLVSTHSLRTFSIHNIIQ